GVVIDWGIQEAEFSWFLERNKLSRGTIERGGEKRIKTYRLYDAEL
ncbi:MAG: N-acetyltransferase, partial [Planctomycetota bacterium]|nr:N-acetyltransferase [Planctomycetota bacterium]